MASKNGLKNSKVEFWRAVELLKHHPEPLGEGEEAWLGFPPGRGVSAPVAHFLLPSPHFDSRRPTTRDHPGKWELAQGPPWDLQGRHRGHDNIAPFQPQPICHWPLPQ